MGRSAPAGRRQSATGEPLAGGVGPMLARIIVYMFFLLLGVSLFLETPVPISIAP